MWTNCYHLQWEKREHRHRVTYWFFHGDTRIWLEPEQNGAVNSWEKLQIKCAIFHSYVTLLEGKRWWSPWLSHQLVGNTHVGYIIKYPHEKSPCRHLSPLRKTCFNSIGIPWNQHPAWCVFTILNPSNPRGTVGSPGSIAPPRAPSATPAVRPVHRSVSARRQTCGPEVSTRKICG